MSTVALLTVVVAVSGCSDKKKAPAALGADATGSGDIPDTTQYVPYQPPGADFKVSTPEGWARADASGRIVFTDRLNSITIETAKPSSTPTIAEVKAHDLTTLQSRYPAFALTDVKAIVRKAGPVILMTFKADSAADPVTAKVIHQAVERYYYFHNGERVILTLAGPATADNVDPWHTVSDSLNWL